MGAPEIGLGTSFWLRKRERSRTRLNAFRCPLIGVVAVDIQPFTSWGNRDREAIKIANESFGQHMVVFPTFFINLTATHDTRVFARAFPGAVGVLDPHLEDLSISVYVFLVETIPFLLIGIWACAATQVIGSGKTLLGSIDAETWQNIDGRSIQDTSNGLIDAIVSQVRPEGIESHG